jgi:hypothetical protein
MTPPKRQHNPRAVRVPVEHMGLSSRFPACGEVIYGSPRDLEFANPEGVQGGHQHAQDPNSLQQFPGLRLVFRLCAAIWLWPSHQSARGCIVQAPVCLLEKAKGCRQLVGVL